MKKLFFLLVLLGFQCIAQDQNPYKLIDGSKKEPIVFANIVFDEDAYSGTTTDIDGIFYIPASVKKITISYMGYETLVLSVDQIDNNIISLNSKIDTLDEVLISTKENPAHRIIKNAVANKDKNNPENLNEFTYTSYDKIVVDVEDLEVREDTLNELEDFLDKSYLFITETVAKRQYLKPRFSEDSIIATRTSGFKNPNFALLANTIQPFSFYQEYLNFFEIDYLNPISKGSTRKYKFRIEDEYLRGKDTIFAISFEPNANRNFDGLKGIVSINSNNYAVQSVDAKTINSGKITMAIQQKYKYVNDKHWFPEQLNFQISVGDELGVIKYVGKSYLSDINLNPSLTKKDFNVIPIGVTKEATQKDSTYWISVRQDSLNIKEQRTYKVIDSIGEKANFDKLLTISSELAQGKYPFKYVDIDLTKIVGYNEYEGLRLGAGFVTNDDISEKFSIGGFAGYGFKDFEWKYGGEFIYDFSKNKEITASIGYQNNLRETGRAIFESSNNLFNFRNIIANQMDQFEGFRMQTYMKVLRNVDWTIGINTADITPLYLYRFNSGDISVTDYSVTELNIGFNYYVNEKLTNMLGIVSRLPSDDPILNLSYTRGIADFFGGDFNYNKFRFTLDHSFRIKGLGRTTYRIDAGYIDASIPYGQLFTGEGSFDTDFPFVFENYFQTVTAYEFLSDRYVHLFSSHNLGTLLNNKGYFTPEVVIHNNIGIGGLSDPNNHEGIAFKIKDEVFLESGLELRNIVKLPYFNIGYLGFGLGGFYRYGFHHLPDSEDNFVLKIGTSFTFR